VINGETEQANCLFTYTYAGRMAAQSSVKKRSETVGNLYCGDNVGSKICTAESIFSPMYQPKGRRKMSLGSPLIPKQKSTC